MYPAPTPSPPGQLFSLGLLLFHHQALVIFQQVYKALPGMKLIGDESFEPSLQLLEIHGHMHSQMCIRMQHTHIYTFMYVPQLAYAKCTQWPFSVEIFFVCMSSYCGYLRSPASPIIDFKWKVSHCACRGWRGKPLKWFLCVSRLSKAFHTGFYS